MLLGVGVGPCGRTRALRLHNGLCHNLAALTSPLRKAERGRAWGWCRVVQRGHRWRRAAGQRAGVLVCAGAGVVHPLSNLTKALGDAESDALTVPAPGHMEGVGGEWWWIGSGLVVVIGRRAASMRRHPSPPSPAKPYAVQPWILRG